MDPLKNEQEAANGAGGQGDNSQKGKAGRKGGRAKGENDKSTRGLEVSSIRDGYRRAGRAWMIEPVIVPLAELTDEQIELLEWDVNIRAVEVDLPTSAPAEAQ